MKATGKRVDDPNSKPRNFVTEPTSISLEPLLSLSRMLERSSESRVHVFEGTYAKTKTDPDMTQPHTNWFGSSCSLGHISVSLFSKPRCKS